MKLKLMMSANRYAWNLLNEKIAGRLATINKTQLNTEIRPFVKKSNLDINLSVYSCPEDCFDSAYRDIIKAIDSFKAASSECKKKTGKGFKYPDKLKNKTKKQGNVSIEIRGRSLKYDPKDRTISFYKKYFGGNHKLKIKTDLVKLNFTEFEFSCRLTCKNDNEYYIMIPYVREVIPVAGNRICSIDPGVRTFLTGYDPSGSTFEIANNNDYIYNKKKQIEQLQKILSKVNKNNIDKKIRIKKNIKKLYTKIKNCINDLHHKTSKMLSETYKKILLPKFEMQKMVNKTDKERKINAKTSYNMLTLSHYKFQQLLKHKMELRKGELIICSEEYTSKTCGNCGRLNQKLGSNKVFICPFDDCKITIDRDINGARNILIKNINLIMPL